MNITPPTPPLADKTILSVSQLNRRAKHLLETHIPLIWVSGEISNLAKPSSGHWYFSLKDNTAQIRCAMFKNTNQRTRWIPESGQQVLVRARVSLYEGRGEYQLIAEHMEMAGDGLLQQEYEQLKSKLNAEGLFDIDYKKTLPLYPRHIGIITSPTGAAIHDILSVLQRRYPIAPITIFPVSVQGENAVPEIINAIQKADRLQRCDLLILSRGGGSIEDLWAFNNEALARTIYHCVTPIISAIGHEVDYTIADFVADVRAPTPSVSAEIATPDHNELTQLIDRYQARLLRHFTHTIRQYRASITSLRKRLRHPGQRIDKQKQQLKYLRQALISSTQRTLSEHKNTQKQIVQRLSQQHPQRVIDARKEQLTQLSSQLTNGMLRNMEQRQQQLAKHAAILHAISPLTVLSRGYSITNSYNGGIHGNIIKNSNELSVGDELSTRFNQGNVISTVTQIIKS